jgi:multimeric flavodoxin WrbA
MHPMPDNSLKILAFNCSLKGARDKDSSSTDVLLKQVLDAFAEEGATGEIVRAVDHDIKPGVSSDEGDGDAWPALRRRVVDADILVMGTPIWLGQPSSVAKRVLERMDAFLGETDDRGRMPSYGKVAIAAVVGNEDGAHHCAAEITAALTEVGFTIPSGGATYWVARRWAARSTRTCARHPRGSANGIPCWPRTRRIWRGCSSARPIPASRAAASRRAPFPEDAIAP